MTIQLDQAHVGGNPSRLLVFRHGKMADRTLPQQFAALPRDGTVRLGEADRQSVRRTHQQHVVHLLDGIHIAVEENARAPLLLIVRLIVYRLARRQVVIVDALTHRGNPAVVRIGGHRHIEHMRDVR